MLGDKQDEFTINCECLTLFHASCIMQCRAPTCVRSTSLRDLFSQHYVDVILFLLALTLSTKQSIEFTVVVRSEAEPTLRVERGSFNGEWKVLESEEWTKTFKIGGRKLKKTISSSETNEHCQLKDGLRRFRDGDANNEVISDLPDHALGAWYFQGPAQSGVTTLSISTTGCVFVVAHNEYQLEIEDALQTAAAMDVLSDNTDKWLVLGKSLDLELGGCGCL